MGSQNLPTPKHNLAAVRRLLVTLILIGIIVILNANRNSISDWWRLKHYTAPNTIVQLATSDTMTPSARKFFYINNPQLQPKTSFKECNLGTERAAILGCYHGVQNGIFILDISDPRLNGIEQVTAAHEMLHAAYDRLSSRQKHTLDAMLVNYYQHDLHDQTIVDQMASYKKSEPDDVVNEMHSVFGTEVAHLPAPLENYYTKYFTNRAVVTKYYANYQAEFTSRQATIKSDDTQLDTLKTNIDAQKKDLEVQSAALQAMRTKLDSYRASSQIGAYNAGVGPFNTAVANYNSEVGDLRGLIAQYNQLVGARNAVAIESQQLTNEISSQVSPIGQ